MLFHTQAQAHTKAVPTRRWNVQRSSRAPKVLAVQLYVSEQ